jgi:LytS/YehU family sensor histidine kinase
MERHFLKTTLSFVGLMLAIYAFAITVMYVPFYHSYKIGIGNKIPAIADTIPFINRTYLFNLPVVAGIATMIKLTKRWLLKQQETEQMAWEKTKAELQLLKAQVHPHFLFNTLNNIYFFTLNASPQAPEMIRKLSSLLQYILNECNQPLVPVEKEIKMLQDYIDLEIIRYGEKLKITTEINGNFQNKMIAPLLLIPFVENSFKHGASKMIVDPTIKLRIACENNELIFFITNSQPSVSVPMSPNGGIGIKNVKKRLQLLYPGTHELNIVAEKESFTIYLKIKILESASSVSETSKNHPDNFYAMA